MPSLDNVHIRCKVSADAQRFERLNEKTLKLLGFVVLAVLSLANCKMTEVSEPLNPNAMFYASLEDCLSAGVHTVEICQRDRKTAQATIKVRPTRVVESKGAFRTWKNLEYPEIAGWIMALPSGLEVSPQLVFDVAGDDNYRFASWETVRKQTGAAAISAKARLAPTERTFITKNEVTTDPRVLF